MEKEKQLTPMMVQYNSIRSKYKDEVLFYRLGDFYEMVNEDAVEISRLLNLTLTSRAGTPMCGIPYHAAKVYIARLLRLGKKIVVCEQVLFVVSMCPAWMIANVSAKNTPNPKNNFVNLFSVMFVFLRFSLIMGGIYLPP